MGDEDQFPPPSADPGDDPQEILREIREQKPRLTCFGATLAGIWALAGMATLVGVALYLRSRAAS
ncbi:MAG: hypothetical protein R6X29_04310 [Acidimicrobiia bacterium]|jgi:hypothetical protein